MAFHPVQQAILMAVIAALVYSVSLDLRVADFRYVARRPLAVAMGVLAQFVLLPGGIIAALFGSDLAMVAVAGLWGVWHIISGGALVVLWRAGDNEEKVDARSRIPG